jgi:hypothetical protein
MKNELDNRLILSVFDKISKHGKIVQGCFLLDGIKAYTDHDGYTLFIEDALVQLQLGFHNQYHFNYDKKEHREQFEKKLKQIIANYS